MRKKPTGNSQTILITGGSGFIGTHLCKHLRSLGFGVRILDLKPPPIEHLGVDFISGDVRKKKDIERALVDCNGLIHLAAVVSVPLCDQDPIGSYQTNVEGTLNAFVASAEKKKKDGSPFRFIFASSAAVYGDTGKRQKALRETPLTAQPLSFYAAQKLAAENFLRIASKQAQIPLVLFRFFNVYGSGQDAESPYSGVISRFSHAIRTGENIALHGGGKQTRDFISVEDISRIVSMSIRLPEKRLPTAPVNVGSGKGISILNLAQLMQDLGKPEFQKSKLKTTAARKGDILYSVASIKHAYKTFHWKPEISLKEGLKPLLYV